MHSFKKALKRGLIFLLIVAVISAPFLGLYFGGTYYYYQDTDVRDPLAGELDTLIVGASGGMRGIIPSQLDESLGTSSYNLSSAMMTMQGRLSLLEYELSRNPVDTVIFEVSYETLQRDRSLEGPEGDLYVLGRWSNSWQRLRFLAQAFSVDELPGVYYDSLNRSIFCIKALLNLVSYSADAQYAQNGFVATATTDLTIDEREYREIYHTRTMPIEPVPENVRKLQKVSDLCRQNGAELIIVMLPESRQVLATYDGLQEISDYYAAFAEENGWHYYDLNLQNNRAALYPEHLAFSDTVHVSEAGARNVTATLTWLIRRQQNNEPTDTLFFNSYDELDTYYGFR